MVITVSMCVNSAVALDFRRKLPPKREQSWRGAQRRVQVKSSPSWPISSSLISKGFGRIEQIFGFKAQIDVTV